MNRIKWGGTNHFEAPDGKGDELVGTARGYPPGGDRADPAVILVWFVFCSLDDIRRRTPLNCDNNKVRVEGLNRNYIYSGHHKGAGILILSSLDIKPSLSSFWAPLRYRPYSSLLVPVV